MSEKRRQYTEECKHEAVRLVTNHGYGVTEAARNLGINVKMLGRWKRQAVQPTNGSLGGNGQMSAEHEELLRLRKENQRLRMEREIVKKRRSSLPKSRVEIRVHCEPPAVVAGRGAV